ncbi:MAG: hypothetical protein ABI690_35045 [Chloroflexota bacterium]
MSQQKMLAAKKLLQEKRYDEARKILKTINHPTAKEWLAKLDKIAPEKKRLSPTFLIAGVVGLVFLFTLLFLISNARPQTSTSTSAMLPTAIMLPTNKSIDSAVRPTLPPVWTPSVVPTQLAIEDSTEQVEVASTQTLRSRVEGTQTAIAVVQPAAFNSTQTGYTNVVIDDACIVQAKDWWSNADFAGSEFFFEIADIDKDLAKLAIENPAIYSDIIDTSTLSDSKSKVEQVNYPKCAEAAREYLLNSMNEVLQSFDSARQAESSGWNSHQSQSQSYLQNLRIELGKFDITLGTYWGIYTGSSGGGSMCNDGSFSSSSGRGSCSHHGGVSH